VRIASVSNDTAQIAGEFANTFPLRSEVPNRGGSPVAQVLRAPLSNVKIAHLNIDGAAHAGPRASALSLLYAVNCAVLDIGVRDLVETPGETNVFQFDTGYQNTIRSLRCTRCGNGTKNSGHVINFDRQSHATLSDVAIANSERQNVFGFDANALDWSALAHISIDQGGANGRPFKILRSSHNRFDAISVKNGGGEHNGISVTDMSSNNTFSHCSAVGNSRSGIATFGNWNAYNTFVDCTSMYNTGNAFAQSRDAFGNFGDHHTTIVGGTFCCNRGSGPAALLQINSDAFTLKGARIYADRDDASAGVAVGKGHAGCEISASSFEHLRAGREIVADPGACRLDNNRMQPQ
jgi:hypothetical protein